MYQEPEEEINPHILCRELPVLVTGGTGYMASWLVKYLLEDGYQVRITVRDLENEDKFHHLKKIANGTRGKLAIFEADLLDPKAFKKAMTGCNIVFHTASPFLMSGISNPKKQLIDPSYEGTRNVLEMVNKSHSVKKVVFTSAISAIYGDASDIENTKDQIFNEIYWNKSSNLKHEPLGFSKTVAEREAWRIHDDQGRWKMVVLNPALILGPSLTTKSVSGSFDYIKKIANGTFKDGVPNVECGFVDVRDVAHAHIFAAQDQYAEGRFMLVHEVKSMLEIASILKTKFGDRFPFPERLIPNKMLYFFGFTKGLSRKYVLENVGKKINFDNKKSRHELGMNYKPIDVAAQELLQFIMDHNMLE